MDLSQVQYWSNDQQMVEKRSSHGSILLKTAKPHSNLKIMDNYLNLMLLTAFSTQSELFINQLRMYN